MKLSSPDFEDGEAIPDDFAFCRIDPDTHVTFSGNENPELRFEEVPDGTRSFALIVHDPDVPSRGDDVNQEGREVPAELPRVDFHHWLLWNIPGDTRRIARGAHSRGVTARGKSGPEGPESTHHGVNDYTGWFAGDADMGGDYFGYDGPCPPWNDALMHHYHFTLYALDVPALEVAAPYDASALKAAMEGHVLAEAVRVGTFTLNPALR